ncbi:MAG: hypothetical protein KKA19_08970 [Candidatus Margulisbacteria bacterium]|nr:hypothetical protein [Candidatus Margulisiibacteriota bacterium]
MSEFSEDTIRLAWERAQGKCECGRSAHGHTHGKCTKPLAFEKRGKTGESGAWQVLRKNLIERMLKANSDDYHKCEILCMDCFGKIHQSSLHEKVKSFLKYKTFKKH